MIRSLGSREIFGNEAAYEFEWALISIDDASSARSDNLTNFAKINSDEKTLITSVASKSAPAGTHLLLQAPRGKIVVIAVSSESSVQLNPDHRPLRLWTVQVDRVENGDCGSWITDRVTGELFGVLVATCESLHEAYILPVKDIFNEIQTVSGHSVGLPTSKSNPQEREPTKASSRESKPTKTFSSSPEESVHLHLPLRAREIRMLTLCPGEWQGPIDCKISIHNLDSSPAYELVSYVLNRENLTSLINVNGRTISVDVNLASALMDLRYPDRARCLWIDALCINQEDDEEKDDQLSLLASIMTRASNTCLWLGKGDNLCQRVFSSYDLILDLNKSNDSVYRYLVEDAAEVFSGIVTRARFHLGNVQAICLARNAIVHCGRDSIPWKAFEDVVAILKYLYDPMTPKPKSSYRRRQDTRDWDEDLALLGRLVGCISDSIRWLEDGQIERKLTLGGLVVLFSWIEPTVHHDAIYSMLPLARDVSPSSKSSSTPSAKGSINQSRTLQSFNGLNYSPTVLKAVEAFLDSVPGRTRSIRPTGRRTLIVNYSQPFEHVCKDFVQLIIQTSQSLDILCLPWAPLSDTLPSWVSQRSLTSSILDGDNKFQRVNGYTFAMEYTGARFVSTYNASRREPPVFHMPIKSKGALRLSVKGFVLDVLLAKGSPALMGNIPPDWMDLLGWNNLNASPPEKAWRTLVGDRDLDPLCPPPNFYRSTCQRVFQQIRSEYGLNMSREIRRNDHRAAHFLHHVEEVVWGRRLIKTEKHDFLGLAPGTTKKRDIVAILYGLSVPVVLRQIQDGPEGESVFKLVGECFIYGMMDGEAMDLRDAHGIQDQTFILE